MEEIYRKESIIFSRNTTSGKYVLDLGGRSYLFDRIPGSLEELKKDRPSIESQMIKANINENDLIDLLKRDWSKEE